MTYEFKCDHCGFEDMVTASMKQGPPETLVCKTCGDNMHRVWTMSIYIPEHMQAGSDAISPTVMSNRLNRSRPSGKKKVLY